MIRNSLDLTHKQDKSSRLVLSLANKYFHVFLLGVDVTAKGQR